MHVLLTDHNSVKTKYEKFEYNLNLVKNQSEEDKPAGFDLGDFSFETDGSINVAFTDFDISSPINIYKVINSNKFTKNKHNLNNLFRFNLNFQMMVLQ